MVGSSRSRRGRHAHRLVERGLGAPSAASSRDPLARIPMGRKMRTRIRITNAKFVLAPARSRRGSGSAGIRPRTSRSVRAGPPSMAPGCCRSAQHRRGERLIPARKPAFQRTTPYCIAKSTPPAAPKAGPARTPSRWPVDLDAQRLAASCGHLGRRPHRQRTWWFTGSGTIPSAPSTTRDQDLGSLDRLEEVDLGFAAGPPERTGGRDRRRSWSRSRGRRTRRAR